VSSVNGAPWGPFSSIVGALGADNGSVIINSAGAISSVTAALQRYAVYSSGGIDLTTNGLGVELKDIDSGGSITVRGDVTVTGNSMILGSVPISVSTLTNVNSINGAAYPPPAAPIPADLVVSTLLTARYVSTPELFISSINGGIYPPPSPGGSPNGSFSTLVVSSFITAPDVNVISSMTFGDTNVSTGAYLRAPGGGSADIVIELGNAGATNGILRVSNANTLGAYGAIDVQNLQNVSSIVKTTNTYGTDINLVAGPGTAGVTGFVNIRDPIAPFGKLQVGQITQLNLIVGISSVMIDTTTSTLNVSSVNGGIPALLYGEVEFGQVTTNTLIAAETYTSTITVSTINDHPFPLPAGIYPAVNNSTVQTISIPGVVSTSIVNVTYVHSGGGGGSQYLRNVIPGTNNCVTNWNQVADPNDTIIWNVLRF
jgi:hypothetical protein